MGSKFHIALVAAVFLVFCLKEGNGHKHHHHHHKPTNCVVSHWSRWDYCSHTCGANGVQTRTRRVVRPAKCGGKCVPLHEGRPCNRFCLNGGTLRYNSCQCRPGYSGTCCQTRAPPVISECKRYSYLSEADRSVNSIASHATAKCDNHLRTGWYRFSGAAGVKMPDTAPARYRCGTHAPGWLRGGHPTVHDGKVSRAVCYHWGDHTCKWKSQIYVTNCGSYYVYYLKKSPLCRLRFCAEGVSGGWSGWSGWGKCSVTCGRGMQGRSRSCTNPPPSNGGAMCHGTSKEYKACTMRSCPVAGGWSGWSGWGKCSVTCGRGMQGRSRSCTNPPPSNGGAMCHGMNKEYKACTMRSCPVAGGWSGWSGWGKCSVTCGRGMQGRSRSCTNPPPSNGGAMCHGMNKEYKACTMRSCPVAGGWSGWSGWGKCSVTCGRGMQGRSRSCTNPPPSNGGAMCHGMNKEYKPCTMQSCSVNGGWSSWSTWGGCLGNCGTGKQSRKRTCTNPPPSSGGASCHGSNEQFRSCLLKPCIVDGHWSAWGGWGRCSKSCGSGKKRRTRSCTSPPPSNGGKKCAGRSNQYRKCNIQSCGVDGGWATWGKWWPCSQTCGGGQQYRKRYCVKPRPSNGGKQCSGDGIETRICNTRSCSAVDGGWATWGKWWPCSQTCGGGQQYRKRYCVKPRPSNGGKSCSGDGTETRICNTRSCSAVDGGWATWGKWWPCSKTCGGGQQFRKRYCVKPRPSNGGKQCSGDGIETRKCNIHSCSVDGGWSPWGKWCPCSKSCGTGEQNRKRSCDNPAPSVGGKPCSGKSTQYRKCKTQSCPADGGWSPWGNWWPCTKTCGTGEQHRKRYCNNPRPGVGGKKCSGLGTEYRKCNTHSCQVHGGWSTWGAWHSCSKTCGTGEHYRVRTCTKPPPSNGGKPCIGIKKETRPCNQHSCSVHGGWSTWGTWLSCSKTCGTGQQHRQRTCTKPPPSNGGKQCIGIDKETRNCNTKPCQAIINGGWGSWSAWSGCSVSCGTGDKLRARQCNKPPPGPGGKFCSGLGVERQKCTEQACPGKNYDCLWSSWSEWNQCSRGCGCGTQLRARYCNCGKGGHAQCQGGGEESRKCNCHSCPGPRLPPLG